MPLILPQSIIEESSQPEASLQPGGSSRSTSIPQQGASSRATAARFTPRTVRKPPFPAVSQRVMPPRAVVKNKDPLAYYFDLPAHERVGLPQPPKPPYNTIYPEGHDGKMEYWTPEQRRYLHELVWLGMLLLNRELTKTDYRAIANAFHRKFWSSGGSPVIRGTNSIHTYVYKDPQYPAFLDRVLPALGGA